MVQRGKMHNPVTGSGGMLMGTISQVVSALKGQPNSQGHSPRVGMRIATLVSLSLTPLRLKKIHSINTQSDQVKVEAQAILFESGLWAPPSDGMMTGGGGAFARFSQSMAAYALWTSASVFSPMAR